MIDRSLIIDNSTLIIRISGISSRCRPLSIRTRGPGITGTGLLEQRLHDPFGAADVARRRGADLHEVFPDGMLVVHRVKRHDALHVRGRQAEHLADLGHDAVGDPAVLALRDPKRRQQGGLLVGVALEDGLQLLQHFPSEDWLVVLLHRHRSTSPITMSTDALIATKSDSRWPSAILGSADRLMNDGGRMRQRTGLAVPSDTR